MNTSNQVMKPVPSPPQLTNVFTLHMSTNVRMYRVHTIKTLLKQENYAKCIEFIFENNLHNPCPFKHRKYSYLRRN
jgi:hypothetical protein